MTNQEIFNKVATHLLTQNAKSLNGRQCAYRGSNGMKCAVGCLILDKVYTPELERINATGPQIVAALEESIGQMSNCAKTLVRRLQTVHDWRDVGGWPNELKRTAESFNLDPWVLKEWQS